MKPQELVPMTFERRIVGLISVVNLNCRQVKVYLFSLLSELEVRLGNFIATHVSEDELLHMTFGAKEKEKYEEVKKRFNKTFSLAGNLTIAIGAITLDLRAV